MKNPSILYYINEEVEKIESFIFLFYFHYTYNQVTMLNDWFTKSSVADGAKLSCYNILRKTYY